MYLGDIPPLMRRNVHVVIYLAFFFITFSDLSLYGQGVNTNVIPPSPNAAALGKFADSPVSLYTGTPQVSIPLYEITEGDLKLPIQLDYHASGLKVGENPSWVGAGWVLNAGGVITRSIRGTPDEGGY